MKRIYALLIIVVTLIVWKPIASQVPLGEGYYYFDHCQNTFVPRSDCPTTFWEYDNLARGVSQVEIFFFGDDIRLYMFAQLILMTLTYLALFFVLAKISNNDTFALFVTIFFATNFTGSYSMMAIGNYQRFLQRVPNLIPLFISFYFLDKYLNKNNIKDFIYSILLFGGSIFLAHHSVFMIPMFFVYLAVFRVDGTRELFKRILICVSFFTLAILITKTDHLVPNGNLFNFIISNQYTVTKTALQLSNLLTPNGIVLWLAKNWPMGIIKFPYTSILMMLVYVYIPVLLIPFFVRGDKRINLIYKMAVLTLPLVCLLNLYAYGGGVPDPLRNFGEDRIYFIPSIFGGIIYGYFAYSLFIVNRVTKVITLVLLTTFVVYNNNMIFTNSQNLNSNSFKMSTFIQYVKRTTLNKSNKIAIIGPSHLLWPTTFLTNFYNQENNVVFYLDSENWLKETDGIDLDKIILVDYQQTTDGGQIIENIIK